MELYEQSQSYFATSSSVSFSVLPANPSLWKWNHHSFYTIGTRAYASGTSSLTLGWLQMSLSAQFPFPVTSSQFHAFIVASCYLRLQNKTTGTLHLELVKALRCQWKTACWIFFGNSLADHTGSFLMLYQVQVLKVLKHLDCSPLTVNEILQESSWRS